jgi:hypothetical protein
MPASFMLQSLPQGIPEGSARKLTRGVALGPHLDEASRVGSIGGHAVLRSLDSGSAWKESSTLVERCTSTDQAETSGPVVAQIGLLVENGATELSGGGRDGGSMCQLWDRAASRAG